jgi:O-antigen/teichoic acid export membrane protein
MTGSNSLYRNAYALMAATVLSSALGMAYWAVAARMYDTETVGKASTAVATMLLLTNAAQLNLSVGLMRFLPVYGGRERRLVVTSYLVAALAGVVAAAAFLAVAPAISPALTFLSDSRLLAFLFISGVSVWTIFSLQDAVLTGIRAAIWVPVENAAFGVLKLGLLAVLVGSLPHSGILVSWVVPMAVILVPVNLLIFRRLLPRSRATRSRPADRPTPKVVAKFVGGDYVGTLLSHSSTTALPLLVISLAGPEESAVFYIAWSLGSALDFIATGTASSFLVEGSTRPESMIGFRRAAARRALLLLVPIVLVTSVLADPLLWVFGEEYRQARWAVVLLCAAAVPRLLLLLRLAQFRIERRIRTVVRLQALACAVMLALSALVLHLGGGSTAVTGCWLFTETLVLGVAVLHGRRPGRTAAASASAPDQSLAAPEPAMVSTTRTRD